MRSNRHLYVISMDTLDSKPDIDRIHLDVGAVVNLGDVGRATMALTGENGKCHLLGLEALHRFKVCISAMHGTGVYSQLLRVF